MKLLNPETHTAAHPLKVSLEDHIRRQRQLVAEQRQKPILQGPVPLALQACEVDHPAWAGGDQQSTLTPVRSSKHPNPYYPSLLGTDPLNTDYGPVRLAGPVTAEGCWFMVSNVVYLLLAACKHSAS